MSRLNKQTNTSHDVNEMKIFNDKIVSACDKTIYVFCALSGKLLHELVGHTNYVRVIEIDKQFIISGSYDRSVKVWNVDTGSCLHTLLGHRGSVNSLLMHGTMLISGSSDGTLRRWDVKEGRFLGILTGGISVRVDHMQCDGRLLIFGFSLIGSFLIKIWAIERGYLRTLPSVPSHMFKYFKLNGGHVMVMYSDGSIKVWNFRKVDIGVCLHTIVGSGYMESQGDLLVSGSADPTSAKIWSLSTGACLHTLAGPHKHSRGITGIGINQKFVVTSSMDRKLKLWDNTTGEFIRDLFVLESGGMVVKLQVKEAKIVCVVHVRALWRTKAHTKLLVLNFDKKDAD